MLKASSRLSLISIAHLVAVLLSGLMPVAWGDESDQLTSFAFGSCADDENPDHPIWNAIVEANPSAMIFMGDNVYLDVPTAVADGTIEGFKPDYERLASSKGFQKLREIADFFATWDDNDYGARDGGREFALRETSQRQFLDFWGVASESARYRTPGVFGYGWLNSQEGNVQVILTDSRYFRSPIKVAPPTPKCPFRNIVPTDDVQATMLGENQWTWLEERLKAPAKIHILVSGIQVIPDEHCFERWGAMPVERQRLLDAIGGASAPTIILSGDRHLGEISMLPSDNENGVGYDLYEVTSSSLSSSSGFGEGEPNRFRVAGDNVRVNNFGLAIIDRENSSVRLELRDQSGEVLRSSTLRLDP